jgi:chemotaxis protein CheD
MASDPEKHVYVHPGHLFFTVTPTLVTTILGSCVSVCLFDPESGAAGLNHYLLPMRCEPASPRYADHANEMLFEKFEAVGIPATALRAKVFGGASMGMVENDLAVRNIAAADEFLRRRGIPTLARDVGGNRGRKLIFRTVDGAAWVRLL